MVSLNQNMDTSKPPADDFAAIPAADYKVMLAAEKANSKGTGVTWELAIMEGEHQGRKLWMNVSLPNHVMQLIVGGDAGHASDGAVKMGQRFIQGFANALGKTAIMSTDELLYGVVIATVGFQSKDPTRNEVKGFKPAPGFAQPAQAAPQQQAAPPAAPPQNAPPPAQAQAPAQAPAQAAPAGPPAGPPQGPPQGPPPWAQAPK